MALVGTVSGSNGTSTTAISGSLVIANSPASSFPTLPNGVKFLVAGSKNTSTFDNPEFLFNVDVFHSGAIGSDQFMQFKPVNLLQIPTNTTASYIYTSGSTNDLYFTQYNGTYTNTTRLRWLEGELGSGLLSGGTLSSTSGSTTYNIASGSGLIVAYNAHSLAGNQVEPYPVISRVVWPTLTSQALPSLATTQITYVAMDSTGTPYLKSTPFIDGDFDDYIVLGRILHTDKLGTNGAVNQPTVSYGQSHFRGDFIRAFGPIKLSGHTFYASGSQGLKKDAGDSYAEGRNYTTDPDSPNYIKSTTDTAQLTSKIFYEYVNGAGDDVILNNGNAGYTVLDFAQYNNNGTLATVGSGNKFTIQRVFWFPNSVNRSFYVYYGNTIYSTIADAQAGISTEVFTEGKNTRDAAIFLGYVIVKGTGLDFTDPTTYRITQAGSFRAVASSGAGATGTPGGSDTYVQFNDANVFNGTSDFRFVKGTGSALVANLVASGTSDGSLVSSGTFQVKNSSGVVVGSISTGGVISGSSDLQMGGNITGSNARLTGDIAVNGGDLTSTSTTFNLLNETATTINFAGGASTALNIGNTTATNTVLGQTKFSQGLSGSLTKLADGTNYLIAGSGVTLTTGSNGSVTLSYPAGSNVTGSFTSSTTWTFNHGMNNQFVIIQTYDTSFNQIIPQNITLTNSNTATITFPTAESGYAVASIGGVGAYVSSSSYALTASYVNTLNQFVQVTGSVSMNGDLAVNGGDITSTAGTFNIAGLTNVTNLYGSNLLLGATSNVNLSGSAAIINAGASGLSFQRDGSTYATLTGDATSVNIGSTPSRTTASFFNANVTTLNIAGAGTSINIGAGSGRTTIANDLVVGTGNILVSNDGTPITLISSGNILAKLDINNNGTGHQFQIQDYLGINQFTVGENGTAEVSGSLLVSGTTNFGPVTERLINSNGSTGIVAFDLSLQGIFYVNAPAADITTNFTTTPTTNLRVITPTVILSQSSTARIVSGCQIDGVWQTINWANGVIPTGTANKQDVFGFSLIRSGSAWKVLGQLSTYG